MVSDNFSMPRRLLLLIIFACLPFTPAGAQLYRWVDDEGVVHYTDSMPPESSNNERAIISKQGIEIDRIKPPGHVDLIREEQLLKLDQLQSEMLKQRRQRDDILLQRYRTEQDILDAQEQRMRTYDTKIQVIRNNMSRTKRKLLRYQTEVDNQRASGARPDADLTRKLAILHERINRDESGVFALEQEKQKDISLYADELQRFRFLKQVIHADTQWRKPENIILTQDDLDTLETVQLCLKSQDCDSMWSRATDYVRNLSDTPVVNELPDFVHTSEPRRTSEIGLRLIRSEAENDLGTWIYLDLNCMKSTEGIKRCKSQKADLIRKGFKAFITADG